MLIKSLNTYEIEKLKTIKLNQKVKRYKIYISFNTK